VFTGIIQQKAAVLSAIAASDSLTLEIASGFPDVAIGESIAVNGVCLTATEATPEGNLFFYLSSETLARSNLKSLAKGANVNLERAMLASTRISGHLVQGHVDGQARLSRISRQGESHEVEFELTADLARYCVEKGSIAVNGVSLTINNVQDLRISIMVIPHTWEQTNFSELQVGDPVNIEVDVIAKYVERQCQPYQKH
jgi:riboflavin synthase